MKILSVFMLLTQGVVCAQEQLPNPLPLAASWNTGHYKPGEGYNPDWQLEMIESDHHMLLTIHYSGPEAAINDWWLQYCQGALRKAAEKRLPICLGCTQWEASLYGLEKYYNLPPQENPCWVDTEGKVQKAVSPFGPVKWWRQLGREWTETPLMKAMQEWYPHPPYVIMLSNNEARDLRWHQAEQSQRYMQQYGQGKSDDFKRKVVGDGYMERYKALLDGIREGLEQWSEKAIFVGYGGAMLHFGRWQGWKQYSLSIPGRIAIIPYVWGGCSPSYYVNDWQGNSDCTGYCPQVESMNLVFQQRWYQQINPNFFWELSTWFDPKWIEKMKEKGQSFPPERYRGYVTWGLWMTKPRVVRHFTGWTILREDNRHKYQQVMEAVDHIHNNSTLAEFWQYGHLVANATRKHPYQSDIPEEFEDTPRWYALNTNLDPWQSHDVVSSAFLNLEVKVWAQAHVMGEQPKRRWLVYAHAPLGREEGVEIEIPDYGAIKMDISQAGSYYVVDEGEKTAVPLRKAEGMSGKAEG